MCLKPDFACLPSLDSWKRDNMANYGGSGRKTGVTGPDGARYMVKYTKKEAPRGDLTTKYVNNVLSEHMSSRILGILGYPVHETALGVLGGEAVVACRNFVPHGGVLIEFEKFMRRHFNSCDIGWATDTGQIYWIFENDPVLSPQSGIFKACYWERFVGDALVGTPDRHKENFGYLIGEDGSVTASPIYDNGGALFPSLSEQDMLEILTGGDEIMMHVRRSPKSAIEMHGKEADYYDMMSSGIYGELTGAVISTVPRIRDSMPAVREFIDGCGFLSETRKKFYKTVLAERMASILEPAYGRCVTHRFDLSARRRLESGSDYSNTDESA